MKTTFNEDVWQSSRALNQGKFPRIHKDSGSLWEFLGILGNFQEFMEVFVQFLGSLSNNCDCLGVLGNIWELLEVYEYLWEVLRLFASFRILFFLISENFLKVPVIFGNFSKFSVIPDHWPCASFLISFFFWTRNCIEFNCFAAH